MIQCKNCETTLQGNFCHNCGQKVIKDRLTVKQLFRYLIKIITNVEKGFWYTVKMLFLNPGKVVRDYWNGKTVLYYHPIRYLFIWATLSILLNLWLGVFDIQQSDINSTMGIEGEQSEAQKAIMGKMKNYLNLMVFFQMPFLGFVAHRFFKKEGFNYAEHLVALTYFFGQTTIISTVSMFVLLLIPNGVHYYMLVGFITSMLFLTYAYRQLFRIKIGTALIKSIFIYIFGFILFMIFMAIVSIIVSLIAVLIFKWRPGG